MGSHPEVLDDQAFGPPDNGSNSGDDGSTFIMPNLGFITGRRIFLLLRVFCEVHVPIGDVYNCYKAYHCSSNHHQERDMQWLIERRSTPNTNFLATLFQTIV